VKITAFWNATPYILVNLYTKMPAHLYQLTQRHIPGDNNLHFVLHHYFIFGVHATETLVHVR